jgi:hypothetical protein
MSNAQFNRKHNTTVQPSALTGGALAKVLDLQALRTVKGYLPAGGGIATGLPIVDQDGHPLVLSDDDIVLHAAFKGSDDLAFVGGGAGTVAVGTTTALGAAIATPLLPASLLAVLQVGTSAAGPIVPLGLTDLYLVADVAVAGVDVGTVDVTLLILNVNNASL